MFGSKVRGTDSIGKFSRFHSDPMANLVSTHPAVDVTEDGAQNDYFLLNATGDWSPFGLSDDCQGLVADLDGAGQALVSREAETGAITFDYSLMFDCDSPVYRCLETTASLQSPVSDHIDAFGKDTTQTADKHIQEKTNSIHDFEKKRIAYSPRNRYYPRLFPAIQLTNHVFVVDADVNSVVEKVFAWVDSKPHLSHDFVASDLTWHCKLNEYYMQSMFDITIYRFGAGHSHEGKFAVELLRTDGEKFRIHQLFSELRTFFYLDELREKSLHNTDSGYFRSTLEGNTDATDISDPAFISEDRIKQTILSALLDVNCDYSSKLEAIKLAGCILSNFSYSETSSEMDKSIVRALDSLSSTDSAFCWISLPPAPSAMVECH